MALRAAVAPSVLRLTTCGQNEKRTADCINQPKTCYSWWIRDVNAATNMLWAFHGLAQEEAPQAAEEEAVGSFSNRQRTALPYNSNLSSSPTSLGGGTRGRGTILATCH